MRWFFIFILLPLISVYSLSVYNPWTRIKTVHQDKIFKHLTKAEFVVDEHVPPNIRGLVTREEDKASYFYVTKEGLKKLLHQGINYEVKEIAKMEYPNGYMSYTEMKDYLFRIHNSNPNQELVSLGKTVEGRDIWCYKFNHGRLNFRERTPIIRFIGNIHGNEVIGREMLLILIEYLSNCTNGNVVDRETSNYLKKTNVWIIPSLNPDGFEARQRWNANNKDLNRGFPDRIEGTPNSFEPEITAIMNITETSPFIFSVNMHGGAEVVNYPFDGNQEHRNVFTPTNENDFFTWISKEYASLHPLISNSIYFEDGITNGAQWYVLYGGMQDYSYSKGTPEVTVELSRKKWPFYDEIKTHWNYNLQPMLRYLKLATLNRVSGIIKSCEGKYLSGRIKFNQSPWMKVKYGFSKMVLNNETLSIDVELDQVQSGLLYESMNDLHMTKHFEITAENLPMDHIHLEMCKIEPGSGKRTTWIKPTYDNKMKTEKHPKKK